MAAESPAGQAAAGAGSSFYSNLDISYRLGTLTQTADPLLTAFPALPSNFWQRGVFCVVARLNWGADASEHQSVWGTGISPSYEGRFRKVYDPRNGAHSRTDSTTWTYSDNPALCVADALRFAWGVGLDHTHIDWASVAAAANACDVTTTYQAASVKLFTLAGVFRSETDLASQIQDMLDSFRGVITFSDGKYKIVADAARTPVWTITDDDILEVTDYVHAAGRAQAYNVIKASYFDKDDAGRETTSAVYEDTVASAAEGVRETAIDAPFCPAEHSAQILAYRKLKELRNGRRLAVRVSDAACALDAFETVTVSSVSFPTISGVWQVDQIDLATEGYILTLREYVSALYDNPTGYLV
jgi:predicted phage tail protein